MEEPGPEPRDEEDRQTSRPTRRGHRRQKRRPGHSSQAKPREGRGGANTRHTQRSRRMTTRSRLAKLNPCRRPRRPRTRRAVKIPGRATSMRTLKRTPGTGRRSVSSVILRRICGRATAPPPTTRRAVRRRRPSSGVLKARLSAPSQTTDCDTRESGIPPDAAGHQKTPGPAAGAAGKNASPSRRHSRSTKSGRPSSSRSGTRDTPRRCCRSGHTRQDSRCSQGRGARQAHEELGKLLQKTDGRAAMDAPPEQEGRPPLLQATGG